MREYLKDLKQKRNFKKFMMEQKDFRYIEDNEAIFYPDKKHYKNGTKVGDKIKSNATLQIGYIDSDCDNFCNCNFAPLEFVWVEQIMKMVKKYDKEAYKK